MEGGDKKGDGDEHKKQRSNSNAGNLFLAVLSIGGVLALIMHHVGYPQLCNLDVVSPDTYGLVDIVAQNPHRDSYTWFRMYMFSGPERSDTTSAFEVFHNNAIIAAICDHFATAFSGMILKGVNPSFNRHLGHITRDEINRDALLQFVRQSRPFYYEALNNLEDQEALCNLLAAESPRNNYDMRDFLFKTLWNPQFLCESHIRVLIRHDLGNLATWMRSAPYEIRNRWMHGLWDLPADLAAFCAVVRARMNGENYLRLIYDNLKAGDTRKTTDSMTYFLREVYKLEDWGLVDIVFERFWHHRVFQQCAIQAYRDVKYTRTEFIFKVATLIQEHFLRVHRQNRENKKK